MTSLAEKHQAKIEKQEQRVQERLYRSGKPTIRIFPKFYR